ncbi:hypothetical protein [Eubacterium oxidoreducens]|uniref:Uncharacterized protein n=1 Tax=Eubacterium oxidoreducens TaxID=1732 RepID=A0A1G6C090_EUBOX|nr:hypothetical protein [Eubacterium oxidoreducens]SDB26235.1 hypothetical protein SAMN02910417_01927 [Eubacterium oxidoreducens]
MFEQDELGYLVKPRRIGNVLILLVVLAAIILGGCAVAKKMAARTNQQLVFETQAVESDIGEA